MPQAKMRVAFLKQNRPVIFGEHTWYRRSVRSEWWKLGYEAR